MSTPVFYLEDRLEEPIDGQAWRVGFSITTVKSDGALFKSATPFGSVDEAYECLYIWKQLGYKGAPSSPASFFRKTLFQMKNEGKVRFRPRAFANRLAGGTYLRAGWQEAAPGFWRRKVYHYDINKAYYWAGRQGLPIDLKPYQPGDRPAVVCMDVRGARAELPRLFDRERLLVTTEDIDLYGLEGRVIDGVTWSTEDAVLDPVFDRLKKILPPYSYKVCTQSYWGMFAVQKPVVMESYKDDRRVRTTKLPMYGQHMPWAVVIVNRIVRKVYRAWIAHRAIRCFVDSVLCLDPMDTGDKPGQWSLEGEYPKGVYIESPGTWTELPRPRNYLEWTKHAGISSDRYLTHQTTV
mgnify:CR=1 FL=1